jgi:hypothetical protein
MLRKRRRENIPIIASLNWVNVFCSPYRVLKPQNRLNLMLCTGPNTRPAKQAEGMLLPDLQLSTDLICKISFLQCRRHQTAIAANRGFGLHWRSRHHPPARPAPGTAHGPSLKEIVQKRTQVAIRVLKLTKPTLTILLRGPIQLEYVRTRMANGTAA